MESLELPQLFQPQPVEVSPAGIGAVMGGVMAATGLLVAYSYRLWRWMQQAWWAWQEQQQPRMSGAWLRAHEQARGVYEGPCWTWPVVKDE